MCAIVIDIRCILKREPQL